MSKPLRWGIIGTGNIARTFAEALARTPSAVKQAVGSRSADKAREFAKQYSFSAAHGSYAELYADPAVDAVYISTPHTEHHRDALAAIRAGKHVLCEKPLAVTVAECEEMVAAADHAGVVLLEAFMYRTHPQTLALQALLRRGTIGAVRSVRSCFTYGLGDGYNVRVDRALRGGGLYDVGCYCIDFSRMATGEEPLTISGAAAIDHATGVDENLAAVLRFPSGALAHFDVGIRSAGSASAEIIGSLGRIVVPSPWKPDAKRTAFTLAVAGRPVEEIVIRDGGDIFTLEAEHLAAVVAGDTAPLIPARNAIGTVRVLQRLWTQIHGS